MCALLPRRERGPSACRLRLRSPAHTHRPPPRTSFPPRPALFPLLLPLGVAAAAASRERGFFEGSGTLQRGDVGRLEGEKAGGRGGRRWRRAARG